MRTSHYIKLLICLFLINLPRIVKSHSVQVAYCVDCAGNLRIFIEHWHGNAAANSTSMTISLAVNNVTTTQTQSPIANIQNVSLANLPGCSTPIISVAGCSGQMNTYNDWVYYDYTGLPTGVPIQFTIISGSNVFTADGCSMYPLTVTFTIPPPAVNNTPITLCTGALTPSIAVPTGVTWTNSNPAIGLPSSGTGSIAPFIAQGPATGVITYSNGCGVQNMTITTTPALTLTPANNSPFCAGNTLNLTTNAAATSYTWLGPNSFTSNVQNPSITGATSLATGAYTVIGMSAQGCTASAVTNVTVNALPVPLPTNTGPYCIGTTMQLNSAAYSTYTWTGPSSFSSNLQNPSQANIQTINAGVYTVSVINANGCGGTGTTNVTVNPLPVISVTHPTNCINSTINLTSSGGSTYSWSGPNSFTSNVQNPNIPSAQLNMTGIYTVTVTDVNNCVNTETVSVTVFSIPNPSITGNSPVCVGNTLNLFSSGGTNYFWNGPGYTGPVVNPVISNVTMAAAGVYTLIAGVGTCTAGSTYTVVINPLPVFNFSNTNVLCNGQANGTSSVNITVGTGPYNYSWNTNPVQTGGMANSLLAGTYSCTVTDANGCISISSTQITEPTQFSVSITSSTLAACVNNSINANAVASGGTGPYTYNWVSGPSTIGYSISESVSGNYTYTVNALDANNCPADASINLTFVALPIVTATSDTICDGDNTTLAASGAASYLWQPGNVSGPTYPYGGSTSINVTVIGTTNGCSNVATTGILVHPNPTANINLSSVGGCVPTCLDFNSSSSFNIVNYNWNLNGVGISGAQTGSYCFDEAATYTFGLQVTDINGCTSTISPISVEIYPKPVADFNHAPIKPIINIDGEVTFTDASWNATIVGWNWFFMNTPKYTSILQNPTFVYSDPGTYVVALVVKSDKGCYDTVLRPIVVGEDFGIYVPNAFTPNGDGLNDIFQPKGFGVVDYELDIFDRWGEKVFSTTKFEEGWNGTFQGRGDKGCEENTYVWLIRCTSVFKKSHELKGHVTLIR